MFRRSAELLRSSIRTSFEDDIAIQGWITETASGRASAAKSAFVVVYKRRPQARRPRPVHRRIDLVRPSIRPRQVCGERRVDMAPATTPEKACARVSEEA